MGIDTVRRSRTWAGAQSWLKIIGIATGIIASVVAGVVTVGGMSYRLTNMLAERNFVTRAEAEEVTRKNKEAREKLRTSVVSSLNERIAAIEETARENKEDLEATARENKKDLTLQIREMRNQQEASYKSLDYKVQQIYEHLLGGRRR